MRKKMIYKPAEVSIMDIELASHILASSIIYQSTIKSTGQEIGKKIDFTQDPIGEDAGKHFNHEWE